MFIPATRSEAESLYRISLESTPLDVILVTGDSYVDSPHIGVSVIGHVLMDAGYRVGIIAQPDMTSALDITRLGEPRLYWGVTGGSIDSLVANYTPLMKKRREDDMTAGGRNDRRPDRAAIAYTNLIRRFFKNTSPIVLGGLEASLRRIAHYDYWDDRIRRSVLFDAKADILVYGLGEKAALELASKLSDHADWKTVRGICYAWPVIPEGYLELPPFETVSRDPAQLIRMFHQFYENSDPYGSRGLAQRQDSRYLVQNPPAFPLAGKDLDHVYELPYERAQHPLHDSMGPVRALDTIRFSVTTHRGCFAECRFCSITAHQGRVVLDRSEESILKEIRTITGLPGFSGYILDVGGPTANMYGLKCTALPDGHHCRKKHCAGREVCQSLNISHQPQTRLLKLAREVPGVRKVFVASGIRHDLVLADTRNGQEYLREIAEHHVSGQLKLAPEHADSKILSLMGKPGTDTLLEFKAAFDRASRLAHKKQFLTYYFIAAHPGCTDQDMRKTREFVSRELKLDPEQVQIFTPTPSTYSTLMYATGLDPFTGESVFVEKNLNRKRLQKEILTRKTNPDRHNTVRKHPSWKKNR